MADYDIINPDQNIINDDMEEYKLMVIGMLREDSSEVAIKLRENLENNIIDVETDMLLRDLVNIIPYNILIPPLRDQLGLSIQSDKDCAKSLLDIKNYLKNGEDQNVVDQIIQYVNSDEGELDDIIPEIDLLGMIGEIPVEKIPELYNCIDYINLISE